MFNTELNKGDELNKKFADFESSKKINPIVDMEKVRVEPITKILDDFFKRWANSYRNPKKIYQFIKAYTPDFHEWTKQKLPARLKRRERFLKIKFRVLDFTNKAFEPFKRIFIF